MPSIASTTKWAMLASLLTQMLVRVSIRQIVRLGFCPLFGAKFNAMSAVFAHQSLTLPQIIDSRRGLFGCKMGLVVNAGKMNFYSRKPPFTPFLGLFAAKCTAICC